MQPDDYLSGFIYNKSMTCRRNIVIIWLFFARIIYSQEEIQPSKDIQFAESVQAPDDIQVSESDENTQTIEIPQMQENILKFSNNWTINASLNLQMLFFTQEDLFQCRGNKPLSMGIGVSYKKIALGFSFDLPLLYENNSTFSESNKIQFDRVPESINMEFDYIGDKFVVNTHLNRHKSFFINEINFTDRIEVTDSAVDLDIWLAGISFRWILRHERLSLQGVYKLNRRQITSSGSPLLGFGIYYNSISSQDMKLPGYETMQHYLYASPLIGYSYSWVFDHGLFINLDLGLGMNYGLNITKREFAFMPVILSNFTIGYHFRTWSFNASFDTNVFFSIQSFEAENTDWHRLIKLNITLFKISKRF